MTLTNALALNFKDETQAANWLCYNQYQGTDIWDKEFPIYANPIQKKNRGFELADGLKVVENVSPHGYAEIVKTQLRFFRFSMIDSDAGICDPSDNWNQLIHGFEPNGHYCPLCQYNAGRMVIAKVEDKWVYRGGHIVKCMHELQGYSPFEGERSTKAVF